jgi:hypothetical protein
MAKSPNQKRAHEQSEFGPEQIQDSSKMQKRPYLLHEEVHQGQAS